jgi:2-(1,2-epoxy-1,2-dihydrophenyl)acetyl-CoA isomerase
MTANTTADTSIAGLVVRHTEGALEIVLDRPERKNALSREMVAGITAAVTAADLDDRVRVIVLRSSTGDFCTGMDLSQSNSRDRRDGDADDADPAPKRPRAGHLQRGFPSGPHGLIRALDITQVPVVAVVRGWAAGIGNALALSADVVIADPTAKFWVPMVPRGFTPDSGNSWILPRLVGLARAKQMILRGKPVDGRTAADWGLIAECVEPDQLEDAATVVIDEFRRAATLAVGLSRVLVHRNLGVDLEAALQQEGIYEELAVRTDDFKEGMKSFAQRREPNFEGR